MAQGVLRLPQLVSGLALPGSLWAGCQLGECEAEPVKPNPVFHTSYVKHCPPELSVLFCMVKDIFQIYWDTHLQPVLKESRAGSAWGCCHIPLCSADSGSRSSISLSLSLRQDNHPAVDHSHVSLPGTYSWCASLILHHIFKQRVLHLPSHRMC